MNDSLVLYFTKENRYSFNALLGAIDSCKDIEKLKIFFPSTRHELFLILEHLKNQKTKLTVAFSFFTCQFHDVKKIADDLRRRFNDRITLIAGGSHATGRPEEVLNAGFDFVISGEGEETIKEVLANSDFANIKGIYFRDSSGKIKFTGKRDMVVLDEYLPFSTRYEKFGPIEITRGCPFACAFCQTSYLFGTFPRHRSVEKIIKAVEIMSVRGLKDIRFISPDAFSYGSIDGKILNLKAVEELLKRTRQVLKKQGKIFFGTFPSEVRPEHVTPETLELTCKYANNKNLVIGAQTGSDKMLKKIRRGHTVKDVYNAVSLSKQYGFTPLVDFIFGLPCERQKDNEETLKAINDFIKMGARIHTHFFMPLPQTPLKNAKPVPLSKTLEMEIRRITGQGKAFGQWEKQKTMGRGSIY